MRFRPTDLGWKGLMLLAALVAAFLATAYSNLFFLLLVFSGGLGGLGLAWTFTNLRGLVPTHVEVPISPAGQPRPVHVRLRGSRRGHAAVHIALRLPDRIVDVATADTVGSDTLVAGTLPELPRGLVAATAVRLTTTFPFGLFVATREHRVPIEIVTTPAAATPGQAGGSTDAAGELTAPAGSRGSTIRELRPFRTGDSLGDVHWKASARRGTAVVKERERQQDRSTTLVVDRRCTADVLEATLSATMAWVDAATTGAGSLRVVSQGADHRIGDGTRDTRELARFLAGASTLPADAPPPPAVPGAVRLPAGGAR
ncbi:MAG: DUF58 domain-containing protein [Planctomycetes bacterium]|nr:DUF58 domain-containing protein [Planctomycetota bacterium]